MKFRSALFLFLFSIASVTAQDNLPDQPQMVKAPEAPKVQKAYFYESAVNDPLKARIYHLENGLTVYMTVYKNAPRLQTCIAVKAGSKHDPADATGLAHYLEHMLFKGTDVYGTKDYAKEEPLLNQIEQLYETYRKTTDEKKRKQIYRQIDSLSGVASKYSIANEYDKMIASLGAQGNNAYTSFEQTVYITDIPTNQLEKWLTIEAERFRKPVMRIFHTELEAVYEEKNRSLDSDNDKAWEALASSLWQKHTYGTQTTIGTIDHLKNPSLTEIKKYMDKYYVPNNIAICLSGDFDMDAAIRMIDEKWGGMKMKMVPEWKPAVEAPIAKPITREVFGPDAEGVLIGFRMNGAQTKDADLLLLLNKVLYNNNAGLIDLNLNQKQKTLTADAFPLVLKDYSAHILGGTPKEGQKLEEVRDLLLAQLELVKKGEFPDWLITAAVNDLKLEQIKRFESNYSRADAFVEAFSTDMAWQYAVDRISRISKITKKELMDFAKTTYNNNYVVVYKRTGEDKSVQKVVKPEITPVAMNRDDRSPFLQKLESTPVSDIEPVFVDYSKDISSSVVKSKIPLLYKENKENKTFNLYYVLDMGTTSDKRLGVAINYLEFLGTSKLTPEQVKQEFYKLGCSYGVYSSEEQVYVSLNGLSENFEKALVLFENLLSDVQPNKEALGNLVADVLKRRTDAKLNKDNILQSGMYNYAMYGPRSPYTHILSEAELKALKPEELCTFLKSLLSYEHRVLYYGPLPQKDLAALLETGHKSPATLKPVPAPAVFERQETGNKVYVIDYDMKQAEIMMLHKGDVYDKSRAPVISLYNQYFGAGGFTCLVVQELRESKALAYSAFARYSSPDRKDKPYYMSSYIGTQADKLPEAMAGMTELMNNMPLSESFLKTARESVMGNVRTERVTKADVLFSYERAKRLGLEYDIRKDIFEKVNTMGFAELKAFQEQFVRNKGYTILVMGKKESLDLKTLEKYGKVQMLTLQDVFGY